jgi:hypothetical protein
MKLLLRGLSFRPIPQGHRLARVAFEMVLVAVACLVVAHGCHLGGHDVDVEP